MKDYSISKKHFTDMSGKIVDFLKKNNKIVFLISGIVFAVFASVFFWCNSLVFCLSLAGASIVIILLGIGNITIYSTLVKIGWAGIMHAVFMVITNVLQTGEPVLYAQGSLAALFACVLLYVYTPKISYHLGLNGEKKGYEAFFSDRKTEYNGYLGISFLYLAIVIAIVINDSGRKTDFDFAREEFVKVTNWQIENRHGNTYYIVTCPKGRVIISPYDHPEIRDISSDTEIKVLTEKSVYPGLQNVKKIEIRNNR